MEPCSPFQEGSIPGNQGRCDHLILLGSAPISHIGNEDKSKLNQLCYESDVVHEYINIEGYRYRNKEQGYYRKVMTVFWIRVHVSFPAPTLKLVQVLIPRATERPAPGRFLTPFPRGLEDGLEGGS